VPIADISSLDYLMFSLRWGEVPKSQDRIEVIQHRKLAPLRDG